MQHTTKMVMVPQDTYSGLLAQQKQTYSPAIGQLSNLDQELQNVLSNPNLSTDEKYHHYQNVFGRYQNLKHQQFYHKPATNPVQPAVDTTPYLLPVQEPHLIHGLPKQTRRKGQLLLEHLKRNKDHFQWMDSGELVMNGHPIPGSNLTDLVHHVTRTRPTVRAPAGAAEFKRLLQNTNVPQEALSQVPPPLQQVVQPATPFQTPTATVGTAFSPPSERYTPLKDVLRKTKKNTPVTLRQTPLKDVLRKRKKNTPQRWAPY